MDKDNCSRADSVRAFLSSFNTILEKDGFLLRSVHFDRDENTGRLLCVRLSYEEKEGGKQ